MMQGGADGFILYNINEYFKTGAWNITKFEFIFRGYNTAIKKDESKSIISNLP